MKKNMPLAEILAMAIAREQEAYFFYMDLMELAKEKEAKDTLKWIANEEFKHRRFLIEYRDGKQGRKALEMTKVVDYKIAENIAPPKADETMNSADIFLTAAHREKGSHAFYTQLAGMHSDPGIKELLLGMANEELKHKEKMEYLYSNTSFAQTAGG